MTLPTLANGGAEELPLTFKLILGVPIVGSDDVLAATGVAEKMPRLKLSPILGSDDVSTPRGMAEEPPLSLKPEVTLTFTWAVPKVGADDVLAPTGAAEESSSLTFTDIWTVPKVRSDDALASCFVLAGNGVTEESPVIVKLILEVWARPSAL